MPTLAWKDIEPTVWLQAPPCNLTSGHERTPGTTNLCGRSRLVAAGQVFRARSQPPLETAIPRLRGDRPLHLQQRPLNSVGPDEMPSDSCPPRRPALHDPERAFRRTAKSCQSIGDLPAIQRNYPVVKADLSIVLAAIVTATDDFVRWEYLVPRGRIDDRLDGGFSCTEQRYSLAKRLRPTVIRGVRPILRRHSSKFIQSSNLVFPD